jgi:hypothetical protein
LAQDAVLREVPIVLMTVAHDPLSDSLKSVIAPHAVLAKPFTAEALRRVVRDNLDDVPQAQRAGIHIRAALQRWADTIALAKEPDERTKQLEACLASYGLGLGIAMSGDLGVIALAELFQMLTLQAQTGVLHVETAMLSLEVYFWVGKIDFVHALRATPALLLGRVLVTEGRSRMRAGAFLAL